MVQRTIDHDTLLALCQQVADVVIALDSNGLIGFINPAAEEALGLHVQDVTDRAPADIPSLAPLLPFIKLVESGSPSIRERVTLQDDRIVWAQILRAPAHHTTTPRVNGMMGTIVHNLKGPLASAKSFIDLIEVLGGLTDKQSQFVGKARLNLVSMLNQIHQLEDMAWMQTDDTLHPAPVIISDLVKRALTHLEGYAQQQKVTLTVAISEHCPLQGDIQRLESVVANLLHNAIKYSPKGGPVTITSSQQDERVIVRITDRGLGIPPEHLPHLFDQFYRVRTEETTRIEGSGLGLSIVKAIVEKHGGEVFVESEPGNGSTFGFWLPCQE